jgi:diguanylate cyclase (GGDEF)-like protein/PAS domain S-box-containing protein
VRDGHVEPVIDRVQAGHGGGGRQPARAQDRPPQRRGQPEAEPIPAPYGRAARTTGASRVVREPVPRRRIVRRAVMDAGADNPRPGEVPAPSLASALHDERLGDVLGGLPDAVVGATRDEKIVFVNGLAGELFGYAPDELLGRPVQDLWPERLRDRYTRNLRLYFATEHPLRFTDVSHGLRRDGSEFVGEMSWGIVATTVGPVLFAIGRDVSAQRRRSRQTAAVAALGQRALRGAGLRELGEQAVAALRETLAVTRVAIRRLAPPETLAASGPASAPPALEVPILTGSEALGLIEVDAALDDVDEAYVHAIASVLGMAASRLRDEERMRHEALHDPLTGLANRTHLHERLGHALARARRDGTAAVVVIDLDGFKAVNDTFGHAAGDEVLVTIGHRLEAGLRPEDTLARMGGDEFVAVCEGVDEPAALALGARLEAVVREPLAIAGGLRSLSASVGVAVVADGTVSPEAVLAAADAAAYKAKAAGGAAVASSTRGPARSRRRPPSPRRA